ncbi:MAG: flavodoxin [Promethearchaeota archaeon CR_4]|nr:MAG: flavodoxin [Candidatus Lokiarchaeota archaeon CR_4]
MVKILVCYYSFEGNTHFIAEHIARAVNGELLRLVPVKDLHSKGGAKYFWGGKQVTFRQKPALTPYDKNPADYDVLFVGTPVWFYTFTPALRSFFSQVKLQGKWIALFCAHGGSKGKTLENMKKALPGNQFLGQIDFMEPLSNNPETCGKQVADWAQGLLIKC